MHATASAPLCVISCPPAALAQLLWTKPPVLSASERCPGLISSSLSKFYFILGRLSWLCTTDSQHHTSMASSFPPPTGSADIYFCALVHEGWRVQILAVSDAPRQVGWQEVALVSQGLDRRHGPLMVSHQRAIHRQRPIKKHRFNRQDVCRMGCRRGRESCYLPQCLWQRFEARLADGLEHILNFVCHEATRACQALLKPHYDSHDGEGRTL